MKGPNVTFLGAAQTVTGSKHLLEYDGKKVLIDCGLFQGPKELRLKNWEPLPVDPRSIDAIVLTHAHLDHTGYLPRVVKDGFKGSIYGTQATLDIARIILNDSARLQEEEAEYANKHKTSRHSPAKPLYTSGDVDETTKLFQTINRDTPNEIFPQWVVTPKCAGHILGAVSLHWNINSYGVSFSGDLGRYDIPILPDPKPYELGNLLICESTYGNRLHAEYDPLQPLKEVLLEGIEKKGPIIIPSFAVGRTQLLLHLISMLEQNGDIPEIPVFVDSPMAIDATEIYYNHRFDFDSESIDLMEQGIDPLRAKRTHFVRKREHSIRLNDMKGSRVIIAGSGMMTGGRVLHHLLHWGSREEASFLFVGYQAPHTRGASMLRGEKSVKVFNAHVPIKASVHEISGLSAHGDYQEMTRWINSCSHKPDKIMLVHGELEAAKAFSKHLTEQGFPDVHIPRYKETVTV